MKDQLEESELIEARCELAGLSILDDLCLGVDTVHYTVELRHRDRGRRQRLTGLGNFEDLRQLALIGVR
jgi:hypothetical protein